MKTIKNDYCVRMFADSGNTHRPALNHVSLQDGYLYATNAHVVGKIKADLCVHKYEPVEKFPNAEKIIAEHVSFETKKVSVDIMLNDLIKIECCFKPKMIDCDICDGVGVAICEHCNSEHECKECNGTGEKPGTELELTSEHDCNFFGKKYKLKYLDLIIKTAVYTDVKEIEISNPKGLSGTIFTVGDFTILLMPCSS
jgi:hypothetical protein